MAATAEAQAVATKEAKRAGIAAAKSDPRTYRGRKPSYTRQTCETVVQMLNREMVRPQSLAATGLSRQAVLRIRDNRARADKL